MRLLIDMNLTPRWVEALRAARDCDCVLITNDLDFPRILAHTSNAKPSVILLRGEPLVPELRGDAVVRAIAESSGELSAGAILTIDWWDRPRARLLPLQRSS